MLAKLILALATIIKITEIYTLVATKDFQLIENPLDL